MTVAVRVIADADWAGHVAEEFGRRVGPGSRICLPTGDTVRPFFAAVANRTDLDGVQIFMLDEFGGLPEGDPGRCETMIRRDLLRHARGVPKTRLPDVDAADPDHEAYRYADLLEDGGIDLAIVGLGRNGHVGMNEPGATADLTTRVVELDPSTSAHAAHYGATITPTWGITVGLAELLAARELWLLVTGEHKSDILHRTLNDPIGPEIPATQLRDHDNFTVFADESAVGSQR